MKIIKFVLVLMLASILLVSLFVDAYAEAAQLDQQAQDDQDQQAQDDQKSIQDKKVKSPSGIVNSPEIKISNEEKLLIDKLNKVRKNGKLEDVQKVEDEIAALQGRNNSKIKANEYPSNSSETVNDPIFTIAAAVRYPCITCNTNLAFYEDHFDHDTVNGYQGWIYTVLADDRAIYVYRSKDNGVSWSLINWWIDFNYDVYISYEHISIATAGNPDNLFIAAEGESPEGKSIKVWKLVPDTGQLTVSYIGGNYGTNVEPIIVTDYKEWASNWYVYVVYRKVESQNDKIMFSRTIDKGNYWSSPINIATINHGKGVSMDYGYSKLHVAMDENINPYVLPRAIDVISSPNYGDSWTSKVRLTSSDDSQMPSVTAGKGKVVISYTRNWQNSGDLDIWYAYSTNNGASWNTNRIISSEYNWLESASDTFNRQSTNKVFVGYMTEKTVGSTINYVDYKTASLDRPWELETSNVYGLSPNGPPYTWYESPRLVGSDAPYGVPVAATFVRTSTPTEIFFGYVIY